MATIDVHEAETSLARLLDRFEAGEREEVVIERDGRPAAKLVPVEQPQVRPIRFGLAEGKYPPLDYEAFQAMDAEIEELFLGKSPHK